MEFRYRRDLPFLILLSFLLGFVILRFLVMSTNFQLWVDGYHLHHFYLGVLFLMISGWISINIRDEKKVLRIAAFLYGAGIGLIADETGLLFTFSDYWDNATYVVVAIITVILSSILLISLYLTRRKESRTKTS
jgi:Ca2+/Na+ antiporter